MERDPTVSITIPRQTLDRLTEHAADLGRSLTDELQLWLAFGAAASAYASLIHISASEFITDPEHLASARDDARTAMEFVFAHAVPTTVDPAVVLAQAAAVSAN